MPRPVNEKQGANLVFVNGKFGIEFVRKGKVVGKTIKK